MFYQIDMQSEKYPNENEISCYTYYSSKEATFGFSSHCHSYNEFVYSVRNDSYLIINGELINIKEGEMVFIPPFVIHQTLPAYNYSGSMILQFSSDFMPGFTLVSSDKWKKCMSFVNMPPIQDIVKNLIALCDKFPENERSESFPTESNGMCSKKAFIDNRHTVAYFNLKGLVFNLISALLAEGFMSISDITSYSNKELLLMEELMQNLIESPQENLSLEDAAKKMNMSYSNFSRTFKKLFGINYVEYKNHLRMRHAEQLLLKTDMSIIDISQTCNFGNITYFNKIFKKVNKLSPSEFRKKQKRISFEQI